MHVHRLEGEASPGVGRHGGCILFQELQRPEVWPRCPVGEAVLAVVAGHSPRCVALAIAEAVQEGLAVADQNPALAVVLRGVRSEHVARPVVCGQQRGPLLVTALVEAVGGVAVDAGLVQQVETDPAEQRQQLLLLVAGQAGLHHGHDVWRAGGDGRKATAYRSHVVKIASLGHGTVLMPALWASRMEFGFLSPVIFFNIVSNLKFILKNLALCT